MSIFSPRKPIVVPVVPGDKPKRRPRPPRQQRPPAFPKGPRAFHRSAKPAQIGKGPGPPPPGFVTARTSGSEWLVYWALMRKLDAQKDPRRPPFLGGDTWTYQKAQDGRFTRDVGSQVVDFVVQQASRTLGMRLQSERFHVAASPQQQARDFYLKTHSRRIDLVIDLFEQDFIADATGEAVCRVVAEALKGVSAASPIAFGTARRTRA